MTNMRRLLDLKQSVWLDYLSRGMTRCGELHAMIADGLRGMTSNPSIFEHAIGHTSDYDQPFVCSRITTVWRTLGEDAATKAKRAGRFAGSWTSATFSKCLYVLMPNRPGDDTRTLVRRISCRTRQ